MGWKTGVNPVLIAYFEAQFKIQYCNAYAGKI